MADGSVFQTTYVQLVQPNVDSRTTKAPKLWGREGKTWVQQQSFGLRNVRPMRSFRPKSWLIAFIACGLQY